MGGPTRIAVCCCRCQDALCVAAGANEVDLPDVLCVAGVKVVNLPDVLCVVAGIRVVGRMVVLGASVVSLFVQEGIQITQRIRQRIEELRGFENSELPQWDIRESTLGE